MAECVWELDGGIHHAQALHAMSSEGTYKAFFRGNGTNVIKNVPENAIKLTVNDRMQSLLVSDRALPITLGKYLSMTCRATFMNHDSPNSP